MTKDSVTDVTLNRAIAQFDRAIDSLTTAVNKNGDHVRDLTGQVSCLSTEIRESRSDINKLEKVILGNGSKGLSTQVELNKTRISKIDGLLNTTNILNTKGRWAFFTAITVAVLTGATGIILHLI